MCILSNCKLLCVYLCKKNIIIIIIIIIIIRGAEAIVHSVRCFLQQSNVTQSVLKLHFQNAFNSLRRHNVTGSF